MTDLQLQIELAKLLPEKINIFKESKQYGHEGSINWKHTGLEVHEEEWLHVCWLIEQGMDDGEAVQYVAVLHGLSNEFGKRHYPVGWPNIHASWQQRARAILKVKGVTV